MKARRVFSVAAIALSLCLLAGLCGCSCEAEVSPALEFQGIPWNSSPEEVCEALGLDINRQELSTTSDGSQLLTVSGSEFFGEPAVYTYFFFDNYTPEASDYYGLSMVQIFYPEDCDKGAILSALTKEYGPEAQEYTQYSYFTGEEITYMKTEEGSSRWFSQRTMADILTNLSEEDRQTFLDFYVDGLSDEAAEAFAAAEPAAYIQWEEDYYSWVSNSFGGTQSQHEEYGRVAWVNLNGAIVARAKQMFGADE